MSTFILEKIGQHLWGFKPRLMAQLVNKKGSAASLSWFARNMPAYQRILKTWGPTRTHLVSMTTSLINGCPYSTFGHAYSVQLHYLKNTGKLFPLSDEAILEMTALPRDQIIEQLCAALRAADLQEEIPIVCRTNELMPGSNIVGKAVHSNPYDKNILKLVNVFAELNSFGVTNAIEPDEAHDPINKNDELKVRYEHLRASAG